MTFKQKHDLLMARVDANLVLIKQGLDKIKEILSAPRRRNK
jgi:hypothetical protein